MNRSVLPSLVVNEPRPGEVNINVFLISSRGLTHTHTQTWITFGRWCPV